EDDVAERPIDHVLVYAPGMLSARAQRVIEQLRWIRSATASGRHSERGDEARARLTSTLAAMGTLSELRTALRTNPSAARIIGVGTRWISYTPFVAPRHLKKHKHTITDQVRAELNARPELRDVPATIEVCPRVDVNHAKFQFFARRRRHGKPRPPTTQPWRIRITFSRPVAGPISLGYGSHFGLGLFRLEEG
ncbi:MAG: type I-U CRISPR-associated protein Cas5/Cas6, partial [Myxococcales bacterium]|nr:type I-U CRISPR-associated protein Cas5/Cas6 [Myxococcales bacterium]